MGKKESMEVVMRKSILLQAASTVSDIYKRELQSYHKS